MQRVLCDPSFLETLHEMDLVLAREVHQSRCGQCDAGTMHAAHYPRSPRGCLDAVRPEFEKRYSYCCSACRRRDTPPSVRFLGRKRHVAPWVLVVPILIHGLTRKRIRRVQEGLGTNVSTRTLLRWRRWWQLHVPRTNTWRVERGRFVPPPADASLPGGLVEALLGSIEERVRAALRLLRPLTTPAEARWLMGPPTRTTSRRVRPSARARTCHWAQST